MEAAAGLGEALGRGLLQLPFKLGSENATVMIGNTTADKANATDGSILPPSADNIAAVYTALVVNTLIGLACLAGFLIMRTFMKQYQLRLHLPAITIRPPPLPTKGFGKFFGWLKPCFVTSDAFMLRSAGLDALVLQKAMTLGLQICLPIAVVGCCFLLPLQLREAYIRGDASYGRVTMANIWPRSAIMWAHWVCCFLFLGWIFTLLEYHTRQYAAVRQHYLRGGDDPNYWRDLHLAEVDGAHVHRSAKLLDVLGAARFDDMLDREEALLEATVRHRHWWQRALVSLTSWTGQESVETAAIHNELAGSLGHVDLAHDVIQGDFMRDAKARAPSGKDRPGAAPGGHQALPTPPVPVAAAVIAAAGEQLYDYTDRALTAGMSADLAVTLGDSASLGSDPGTPSRRASFAAWLRENKSLLIGLVMCQIGMMAFNLGLTYGFTSLGDLTGKTLPTGFLAVEYAPGSPYYSFAGGLTICLLTVFLLGVFATCAEPALNVLGETVETLSNGKFSKRLLVWSVAVGVAVGMAVGATKILFQVPLIYFILAKYAVACALTVVTKEAYAAVAWDSAGVTTGPVTVPFVLSIGIGFSVAVQGVEGFGLLTVMSVAPIISVLVTSLMRKPVARAATELARISKVSMATISRMSRRDDNRERVIDFAAGVGVPTATGGAGASVSPGLAQSSSSLAKVSRHGQPAQGTVSPLQPIVEHTHSTTTAPSTRTPEDK